MTDITERLRELSKARWDRDAWERETTVRIPAEPDRDIDLVLASAAEQIDRLRARVAELESLDRGGWVRTCGADHVVVPRDPTPEMLRAGFLSHHEDFEIDQPADAPGLVYKAMIDAAIDAAKDGA